MKRTLGPLLLACLAACAPAAGSSGQGHVRVLYAGSLVNVMEHRVGPAFQRATGVGFDGFAGGSKELANEVSGHVRVGDVFLSASPAIDRLLETRASGHWVDWYVTFASTPLVIGYNPGSRYAAALRNRPWYRVLTDSGIRVGRTDPQLDPKGKLTVAALAAAQRAYRRPGLAADVERHSQVFPEEELVGRLAAGQLDAGFFYRAEAVAAHIPFVGLGKVEETASYTVTVLNRAPNRSGALAFVRYLLGPAARRALSAAGLTLRAPSATGRLPASLVGLVRG